VATQLAYSYVVPATFTIGGMTTGMPTKTRHVKFREFLQFGFVASWQPFRDAVREEHFFLVRDDDLPKDVMLSPRFTFGDYGFVWKHCVGLFNHFVGEEPSDLRMRIPPPTTSFDGLHVSPTIKKKPTQGSCTRPSTR
jgi:hypothetical protein